MERDDDHAGPLLECKGADVVVHAGARGHGSDGGHDDLAVVVLLEELQGIDDVVREVGVEGASAARAVRYEEWGGAASERDEVDDVAADGALGGGVGDVEEADEGWSVLLAMDAGEQAELCVMC